MKQPNILIAVPAYRGDIKARCVNSLFAMGHALRDRGISHSLKTLDWPDIAFARNVFASISIIDNFTHLFFLDADMQAKPSALMRMLDAQKPVIGCACPKRLINFDKMFSSSDNYREALARASEFNIRIDQQQTFSINSPIVAERIGMACSLIETNALKKLSNHVRRQTQHNCKELIGPIWGFFDLQLGMDNQMDLTEDYAFCERWKKSGGSVWAILDEPIGHIGEFIYDAVISDALVTK